MKLFDFDKLVASLSGFIETKVELVKMDVEENVKKIVARGVIFVFIGLTISMAIFLLSIGLASFINNLLESDYWGYIIMAAVYLLVGLMAYLGKEQIYTKVVEGMNTIKDSSDEEQS